MNKIRLALVLVFTLIGAISLFGLFRHDKPVLTVPHPIVVAAQAQLNDIVNDNAAQIDSLCRANKNLKIQLKHSNAAADKMREDNRILHEKIARQLGSVRLDTDTVQKLADCDSILQSVGELMQSSSATDSINSQIQYVMESQLDNRDSVIELQQATNAAITLQLNTCIAQGETLTIQIASCQKQLVRQQEKNKFLRAGILVLSGIAIYGLFKH